MWRTLVIVTQCRYVNVFGMTRICRVIKLNITFSVKEKKLLVVILQITFIWTLQKNALADAISRFWSKAKRNLKADTLMFLVWHDFVGSLNLILHFLWKKKNYSWSFCSLLLYERYKKMPWAIQEAVFDLRLNNNIEIMPRETFKPIR